MLRVLKDVAVSNRAPRSPDARVLHNKQLAVAWQQKFTEFAKHVCVCPDPGNRVAVRKATWQIAEDIPMAELTAEAGITIAELQPLLTMPCPVVLQKNNRLAESTPRDIVHGAKRLRHLYNFSETTTCRSCEKRARCPWFKLSYRGVNDYVMKVYNKRDARKFVRPPYLPDPSEAKDLMRVLFGFWQYCRMHMRHGESKVPMTYTLEHFEAAHSVLEKLARFFEPRQHRAYHALPRAKWKDAKRILTKMELEKRNSKSKFEALRTLHMPAWLRELMEPTKSKGLREDQLKVIDHEPDEDVRDVDRSTQEGWITEEEHNAWTAAAQEQDDDPGATDADTTGNIPDVDPVSNPTAIDRLEDIPIPRRFVWKVPPWKKTPVLSNNLEYRSSIQGVAQAPLDERDARPTVKQVAVGLAPAVDLRINIDDYLEGTNFTREDVVDPTRNLPKDHSGYTIVDMVNSPAVNEMPEELRRLVAVSPRSLQGVQMHSTFTEEKMAQNNELLQDLWSTSDSFAGKLAFLHRIPFDTVFQRSGGTAPPVPLPEDKLSKFDYPMMEAPDRRDVIGPNVVSIGDGERDLLDMPEEEEMSWIDRDENLDPMEAAARASARFAAAKQAREEEFARRMAAVHGEDVEGMDMQAVLEKWGVGAGQEGEQAGGVREDDEDSLLSLALAEQRGGQLAQFPGLELPDDTEELDRRPPRGRKARRSARKQMAKLDADDEAMDQFGDSSLDREDRRFQEWEQSQQEEQEPVRDVEDLAPRSRPPKTTRWKVVEPSVDMATVQPGARSHRDSMFTANPGLVDADGFASEQGEDFERTFRVGLHDEQGLDLPLGPQRTEVPEDTSIANLSWVPGSRLPTLKPVGTPVGGQGRPTHRLPVKLGGLEQMRLGGVEALLKPQARTEWRRRMGMEVSETVVADKDEGEREQDRSAMALQRMMNKKRKEEMKEWYRNNGKKSNRPKIDPEDPVSLRKSPEQIADLFRPKFHKNKPS
mmetsp:Transcript_22526/g.49307  ORF Transcript_22526/g.49307 Transcript_22526/m.49307 type:complete len:986 (-) Transcript_22526:74-3031(-)